ERGRLDFWDTRTGALERTLRSTGSAANNLTFSPDGKTLAIGHKTGSVQLLDVESGKPGPTFYSNVNNVWIHSFTVLFSPDNRFLCVDDYPQRMQLWDIAADEVRWRGRSSYGSVYSADGKTLFVTRTGQRLSLVNAADGVESRTINLCANPNERMGHWTP